MPKSQRELAKEALAMKRGEIKTSDNAQAHKMMREMSGEELRNMANPTSSKSSGARDYKKEYQEYHGKPGQIKKRAERNNARRQLGLKMGDGKEADHKKPLSKGGSNSKANLRVVSRTNNRRKYNK